MKRRRQMVDFVVNRRCCEKIYKLSEEEEAQHSESQQENGKNSYIFE